MAVADDLISGAPDRPCGYARYATQLTAATDLEVDPTDGDKISELRGKPNRALLQAEAQDIRWTDDADVTPTATVGMLLKAGAQPFPYTGDLTNIRFFQAAATAILHVHYYNS